MSCNSRNCCGCHARMTLSGTVRGIEGPASGITIEYTVNCRTHTIVTDAEGRYQISMTRGSCVSIELGPVIGVTVSPEKYMLCACHDRFDLDFTFTPVTVFTVSGTVFGLPSVAGTTVDYTIDGVPGSTVTNANGDYAIIVPPHADIIVTPRTQLGYLAIPTSYAFMDLIGSLTDKHFAYVSNA